MSMNFSGNYFSVPLSEPSLNALVDDPSLNNFLDSGSCQLLGAQLMPDEGRIIFNTKVSSILECDNWQFEWFRYINFDVEIFFLLQVDSPSTKDKLLVFFKIKPDVITADNLADVFVSSMIDSPISSLYHSLQTLYAPILLKVHLPVVCFDLLL